MESFHLKSMVTNQSELFRELVNVLKYFFFFWKTKWVRSFFFPPLKPGASVDLGQAKWMLFPKILNLKAVKSGQEEPWKVCYHSDHSAHWPHYPCCLALQKALSSHPSPKLSFQTTSPFWELSCPSNPFLYAEDGESISRWQPGILTET